MEPDQNRTVSSASDEQVLKQYEAYPYPTRDPRDEAKGLHINRLSSLPDVNHYLFAGRRDFADGFRVLMAGGGTGDATIMIAQQLTDCGSPGEVVHLDISEASRRVAEARAKARGLANIRFVTASLLDLPDLGLGRFDYIDCSGVLHHLEDPAAGLAALVANLADGGGLGIMVYGELGRTGLYPLQAALRTLGRRISLEDQIQLARRLLADLPATNWFRRNPFLGDHKRGDAELVDLCLHARDRAYCVSDLADLLASAGLAPVTFVEPIRYEPASYLHDPKLLKEAEGLTPIQQASLAETLAGNLKTHLLYAAPITDCENRIARPEGPEAVPLLTAVNSKALMDSMPADFTVTPTIDGVTMRFVLPRFAQAIFSRVDGKATLGQIHQGLQASNPDLDWPRFKDQFDQLYKVLNGFNAMLVTFPKSA